MPNDSAALSEIRAAMKALEKARTELSAELIKAKDKSSEYRHLLDLHSRVTKAMALLPHGGER